MNEVTRLLAAVGQGDGRAAEQLFPLVYEELRRLAARELAHEKPGHTLQPTALVHEAFVRLVEGDAARQWESRRHFLRTAAEAMRRILIDAARRKRSQKRGGGHVRHELDATLLASPAPSDDLLALDEALTRLAAVDPVAAELVTLRYFSGLTLAEAADTLNISPRTADRLWSYARAWLLRALRSE